MRTIPRSTLAAALGVAATLTVATPSHARPWTTTYDWTAPGGAGIEGWREEEQPAGDGQPGPFYLKYRATTPYGPGLALTPIGGRVYGNGDPSRPDGGPGGRLVLDAPGASRFTSVTFGDARFRNQSEGQVFRLRIGVTPLDDTRDYYPTVGYPVDTTHDLGDVTVALPLGAVRTELALLTTCRGAVTPDQPPHTCPNVSPASQSFGQVRSVRLTLDDPDPPAVAVSMSPDPGDGYENRARPRTLSVSGTDTSSGIRRIRVDLEGSVRRTLLDRTVSCDPSHRSGRGVLECPPQADADARDTGRDGGAATRTYTVTVTDFAGHQTVRSLVVRRDLTPPSSATLSGRLTSRPSAWTNSRASVPVRLTASDALSGVGRIELQAVPQGAGRPRTLAAVTPDCADGCRRVSVPAAADLAQVTRDGRYRLQLVATDRAGNRRTTRIATPLRIDRTPPRSCRSSATFTLARNGRVRVIFPAGSDPAPGSGVRRYVFRYREQPARRPDPAAAAARFFAVDADATQAATGRTRFRGDRARTFEFRLDGSIDVSAPAALLILDDAEGEVAAPGVAGGERGNVTACAARLLLSSGQQLLEDELERLWDLPSVEKRFKEAERRVGLKAAGSLGLRTVLRFVGVGLGELIGALVWTDSTSCKADRSFNVFNDRVHDAYAAGAAAVVAASRAGVGGSASASRLLQDASRRLNALKPAADAEVRRYGGNECASPAKVSLELTPDFVTATARMTARNAELEKQKQRRDAYQEASNAWTEPRSGIRNCRNLPPRGWVVYWAIPPRFSPGGALIPGSQAAVDYVGIANPLSQRCRDYAKSRSKDPAKRAREKARAPVLETLDLPYLSKFNARRVEEALIAHFGPTPRSGPEPRNGGGPPAQLSNARHEIKPELKNYCHHLLIGQYILSRDRRYVPFTAARYTRGRVCPGVGGPR